MGETALRVVGREVDGCAKGAGAAGGIAAAREAAGLMAVLGAAARVGCGPRVGAVAVAGEVAQVREAAARAGQRGEPGEAVVSELTVFEAAVREGEPRAVDVTIIAAGRSRNRLEYPADVLRRSVPLWEGASAFVDHPTALEATRAGRRSLRDLAGVYEGVHFDEARGAVRGVLRLYAGAQWAHELIREAVADRHAGRAAPNIGISADMRVRRRPGPEAGTWLVEAISAVSSADLVFQPSAGGSFDRVLEERVDAASASPLPEGMHERGQGGEGVPGAAHEGEAAPTGGERALDQVCADGGTIGQPGDAGTAAEPGAGDGAAALTETLEAAREELAQVRAARREAALEMLDGKLAASRLPERMRGKLRRVFEARAGFTAAEVDAELRDAGEILAELAAGSVIAGAGAARVGLRSTRSPLEKLQLALDRLFGVALPDAASDVPRLSGIREAYVLMTGDKLFDQQLHPDEAVLEADEVTTSVIANALANSMTKRLTHDYRGQPKWWQPFVVKSSVSDFREQHRIHLNDFASLATVAENGAYTNLAWGDTREKYTPTKRGNLVVVTFESIVNDDTEALRRIPGRLAVAAATTVNEFVAGLFTENGGAGPVMADRFNVFHALEHQGNAGSDALASASLQAALIAMRKMGNSAGKRLSLTGRYLLVPPDLEFVARTIVGSVLLPGGSSNDINPIRDAVEVIPVPQWTDPNNWYLIAPPSQIEMIELGFLNGREEPELLLQDGPTVGAVFTNDAISWKVRHIFGGGWLDYRGAFGSVVA
jgi:hypothetical protein